MSTNSPTGLMQSGSIAIFTMNRSPVNRLGLALRAELIAQLDRTFADSQIDAIVLTRGGTQFSAASTRSHRGMARG